MTKTIGILSLAATLLVMILFGSRNAMSGEAAGMATSASSSIDRSTSGTTLTTAGFSLMTPTPTPTPAAPAAAETAPSILDTLTLAPGDAVDHKPRRTRRSEKRSEKAESAKNESMKEERAKAATPSEPAAPRTRTPQRRDDAGPVSGDAPALFTVPVAGVVRRSLADTWGATRSEGRAHEGIDIFAERNTPVIAAADGRITRQGESERGGLVVWVQGSGGLRHYYAHLEAFSDHAPGDRVRAGDTIGYVGNSGNAITTPTHLHYGVYTDSGAVNPYPLLVRR